MPDGDGGADLMSAAELKPLLMQSKRKPVSCAVGLTKDKQGVLLLDRKVKPRKLMAELKSKAKSEGMDLDTVSVRFGRVAVGADDGAAVFTVNKAAPAALRMKLVEKLRPAGVRKVEIGVDESLEDESDEEADAGHGSDGQEAKAASGQDGPDGGAEGHAAAPDDARHAPVADPPQDGPPANGGSRADAAGAGAADAPAAPGAGAGPTGKAGVARRLAGLVRRMAEALPGNPPGAADMRATAVAGQKAVQAGDLAVAGRAADTLERLLGGPGGECSAAAQGAAPDGLDGADTGADAPETASPAPSSADGAPGDGKGGKAPGQTRRQPATAAPRAPTGPLFDKASALWTSMRGKLERDIQAVLKSVAGEPGVEKGWVEEIHSHVEPIIKGLDDSLAQKLAEIAKATGGGHGKLVGEAQAIVERYKAFVDAEPMIAHLDANPMRPVAIRATVDQALASLSRVLATAQPQAGGGQG